MVIETTRYLIIRVMALLRLKLAISYAIWAAAQHAPGIAVSPVILSIFCAPQ
jgi:hypothetical protein